MIVLLLGLLSCEGADPCPEMCSKASIAYDTCLTDWGLSWPDAGYTDSVEFFYSCETWAWASRQIDEDAGTAGRTSVVCVERDELLSTDFSCEDWADIDWGAR